MRLRAVSWSPGAVEATLERKQFAVRNLLGPSRLHAGGRGHVQRERDARTGTGCLRTQTPAWPGL